MNNKNLIAEYEKCLLQSPNHRSLSVLHKSYFSKNTIAAVQNVIALAKYCFQNIMHWTPQETKQFASCALLKKFRLTPLIKKYIVFPPELSAQDRLPYFLSLCYPKECQFNHKEQIISFYQKTLCYANEHNENIRFPKDFWVGDIGLIHSCLCLQYMINCYITVSSIQELYGLFADTERIVPILKKYGLYKCCMMLYNSPLEYLHSSLINAQRNDFLYAFYQFQQAFPAYAKNIYVKN